MVGLLLGLLVHAPPAVTTVGSVAVENPAARFDVVVLACRKDHSCPLEVRYVQAQGAPLAARLPWNTSRSTRAAWQVTPSERGGWLLEPADRPEDFMRVHARVVTVASDVRALLVTQEAGFEHTHRTHALYAVRDGALKRVWEAGEGQGPATSHVTVMDVDADGAQDLVMEHRFYWDADDHEDTYTVHAWSWRNGKMKEVPQGSLPPVFGVIAASRPDVAQARAAAAALNPPDAAACLAGYLVLSTGTLPRLTPGLVVVMSPHLSEQDANAALARLKTCAPKVDAYVKRAQ